MEYKLQLFYVLRQTYLTEAERFFVVKRIHILTPDASLKNFSFTHFDAVLQNFYIKMELRGTGTFHIALAPNYQKPEKSTYEVLIGPSNSTVRKHLRGPNVVTKVY